MCGPSSGRDNTIKLAYKCFSIAPEEQNIGSKLNVKFSMP